MHMHVILEVHDDMSCRYASGVRTHTVHSACLIALSKYEYYLP